MAASADDLMEKEIDMTTCPICLESMTLPKYLPCLHSFCQCCILEYCKAHISLSTDVARKTMECPVCRLELAFNTEKCEGNISPEEWTKQLPLNFLIVELLDRAKLHCKTKVCISCERLGQKGEGINFCIECGELLCQMCTKYHHAQKTSVCHNIKAVSEIEKEDLPSCQQFCHLHSGEILKLYCCDHDTVCCSVCVSVDHRKCDTVKTLENASKGVRESEVLRKVKIDLMNNQSALKSLNEKYVMDEKDFEKKIATQINTTNHFRRQMKEKVDNVSDQLVAKLTQYSEDSSKQYSLTRPEIENRLEVTSNDLKILKIAVEKASNVQIMSKIRELEEKSLQHKKFTDQQTEKYFHMHLTTNLEKEADKILTSLDNYFASAIADHCKFPDLNCNSLTPIKLEKMFEIEVNTEDNEACFSSTGNIFLANFGECCINVYDMQKVLLNSIKLDYSPHNIASDHIGHVAIVNKSEGIVELLNEQSMKVENKYNVSKEICGVALTQEQFVVCTSSKIELYERSKGRLVQELNSNKNISWYLHFNNKGFYFSCGDIVYFHGKEPDAQFVYTTKDLKKVEGIETDIEGNVYVADSETSKIVQISCDGSESNVLLSSNDGMDRPRGVGFSKDQKYMFVVNHLGKSIIVYQVNYTNAQES